MATEYVPDEFSRIVKNRRPQRTQRYPGLPDIVVTYDKSTKVYEVANASIEAVRMKSLTGKTHTIALVNGGRS